MILDTIINRVEKYRLFVYGAAQVDEQADGVMPVRVRMNGRPVCTGCGGVGPTYDRLPERWLEFVPL